VWPTEPSAPARIVVDVCVGKLARLSDAELAKRDAVFLRRGVYEPTAWQRAYFERDMVKIFMRAIVAGVACAALGFCVLFAGLYDNAGCNALLEPPVRALLSFLGTDQVPDFDACRIVGPTLIMAPMMAWLMTLIISTAIFSVMFASSELPESKACVEWARTARLAAQDAVDKHARHAKERRERIAERRRAEEAEAEADATAAAAKAAPKTRAGRR